MPSAGCDTVRRPQMVADTSESGLFMSEPTADSPEFSIMIAAFNAAATIRATLDSLVDQTESSWRACVVDDGSSDDTFEIALEYARRDSRFTVLQQANAGSGAARNRAAQESTAEYLCILDADDAYKPTYLERQKAFVRTHPGFDIYSCTADAITESGDIRPYDPGRYPQDVCSLEIADLVKMNRILSAAVIRAASFRNVGGFRESVYVEDYDLWLRMLAHGANHIHNPESLVLYRVRSDAKTADSRAALSSMREVYCHLLTEGTPGPALAREIRRQIRSTARELERIQAHEDRRLLERRFSQGDYANARRLYWSARRAWGSPVKYGVGLVLVVLSPRWLAAVLSSRTIRPARTQR